MRTIEIRGAFGLDNLALVERPEPVAGPGQVMVAMRAASLNYRDLMMILGSYNPKQRLPLIPCSDGAGMVEAVGPGVTRVAIGDRVATTLNPRWIAGEPARELVRSTLGGPLDGVLQERMVFSEEGVVRVPAHLSDVEAATLPCAALTAWSALDSGRIGAGDTVLIQGTGGVAIFALQLAKLRGARVLATTRRAERAERLLALGAEEVVDSRRNPDWGAKVRDAADGQGVDLVVEIGGAGTLEQSLKAVRIGGTVALIGILDGNAAAIPLTSIFMQAIRLQGVLVGSRETFERMNRAIELHGLHPVIHDTYPWTEVRAALETMATGDHFGKICLTF
ncbi:MAG: NAD(P)-dependent alcohol dehydrogenase [Acidobacteriota bacterium]